MLIAHASDLTGDDLPAFVHASALAATSGARLVTIHGMLPGARMPELPDASELAARWGRTIAHERRCYASEAIPDALIEALHELRPELVVIGTHARHGIAAFVRSSVSEALVRELDVPVLVVPNLSRGFVDEQTGAVELQRIVVPAGTLGEARSGLAAVHLVRALSGVRAGELDLVHIGPPDPLLAQLEPPITHVGGPLEDAILDVTHDATLIVMPTHGHDGPGQVVLGPHTERVIRNAPCPVLVVPM